MARARRLSKRGINIQTYPQNSPRRRWFQSHLGLCALAITNSPRASCEVYDRFGDFEEILPRMENGEDGFAIPVRRDRTRTSPKRFATSLKPWRAQRPTDMLILPKAQLSQAVEKTLEKIIHLVVPPKQDIEHKGSSNENDQQTWMLREHGRQR